MVLLELRIKKKIICSMSGGKPILVMSTYNFYCFFQVVIFVYDLTNLQSFEKLSLWITTVKNIFDAEIKKPLMALFGNKSDLEHQRAVRLSCVQKLASENLLEHFKGSARTGEMVIPYQLKF